MCPCMVPRSVLAAVVTLLLVPASAEYGGTDPEGDVAYHDPNLGQVPAARDHPSIDIVSVLLHGETEETLTLTLEVAGEDPAQTEGRIQAGFTFDALRYTVSDDGCEGDPSRPAMRVSAGLGGAEQLGCLEGGWLDETTFEVTVPKAWIRDRASLPLGIGRWVEDLQAQSVEPVAVTVTPQGAIAGILARDEAPDDGGFPGRLVMALGPGALGDLVLSTPAALRASNGGPDTLVFPVTVANRGAADDAMLLEATQLPADWQVRTPGRLSVAAGQERTFPVVLTTASAHSHGSTQTFVLEATSEAGERGQLELGIHYLDIPQLAGHHSTVFFHSLVAAPSGGIEDVPGLAGEDHVPWFNTLSEQEGADEAPFGTNVFKDDNRQDLVFQSRWSIPLDPALLIGMDFAPERSGALDVHFVTDLEDERSVGRFDVAARLMHCHPQDSEGEESGEHGCPTGSWFELADAGAATFQVEPDSAWTWSPELDVTDYADLVPYVDGSNIALWIDGEMTASSFPRIDPTLSKMQLPLNEYKDPIDATFEALTSLQLIPLDRFEKLAHPGQTVWFSFELASKGAARSVEARAFGHNADWATVLPEVVQGLAADGRHGYTVRVDVPEDARVSEFAEVLLIVEDVDDGVTAVSKMRVQVTDDPVPEEEAPDLAPRPKSTPAVSVLLAAIALAGAALRRR